MVFGTAVDSIHSLKRGDGQGIQSISHDDLTAQAGCKEDMLIGVEVRKWSGELVMMKYKLNPSPFKPLLERQEAKCRDLAKQKKKWTAYRRSASRMAHLGSSCDPIFTANYCIVSGVPSQYFNGGTIHDQIIEKLRKAMMGKCVTSKACELSLVDIKNKRRKAIKLSNMGWRQINSPGGWDHHERRHQAI